MRDSKEVSNDVEGASCPSRCSAVIELEIQSRIERRDHCDVFTVDGSYVGFVSLIGNRVKVQRCGLCRAENYAPAVISGVCCGCGWDANDALQAVIVKDHR